MDNNVIKKSMIFLDENINNKIETIDYILKEAFSERLITEIDDLKQAIIDRENQVSTAVGFEVAMPHGKTKSVTQPFISFLRTEESFRWSQENDETVQMVILIAVPEEDIDNTHLKVISAISRKLLDDDFREKLLLEKDIDNVYKLLLSIKK
ncbi:PTS sugar transporter subunit IIA [Marinilactibacillus psychrotolerans]|uniref:PTS sugar transporter subunit IIA n=1 Tax=Marinilactibacillus psychrotolerans TaxID=191770 RepID=UPI001867AAE4|nr:fructose PTS transporter subunit IIA [Marinilactibacillus psychrotolerans]